MVEELLLDPAVLSGITRSVDRADVGFVISGTLAARHVELGEHIAEGDELARVYRPELEPTLQATAARVEELEARLRQIERDLARSRSLADEALLSTTELEGLGLQRDVVSAALRGARARHEEARRLVRESRLTAPFDGTIAAVHFEVGEFVPEGRPVLTLAGTGPLEIEIGVPEQLLPVVRRGEAVLVRFPLLGARTTPGRVVHLTDATGPGRLFRARVELPPDPALKAGLTAEVLVPRGERRALTVPTGAIVSGTGTGTRVFRVRDGHAEAVDVRVLSILGSRTAVLGALDRDETVVTAGLLAVREGAPLRVIPSREGAR